MPKRDRLNVDDFFGEIDQSQEVHSLREKVEELERTLQLQIEKERSLTQEIEHIRSQSGADVGQEQPQIEQLRDLLESNQGKIRVPVANIQANPHQPRQTFIEEVESMKASLQKEGQLTAIILYPDGTIFDGECRWRAASELGWEILDAVFIPKPEDSTETRRRAYLTSLHRRSLNDLDRAEALVAIVCDYHLEIQPDDVARIVNRVVVRLKRQGKLQKLGDRLHLQESETQKALLVELGLNPEEVAVFSVLLGLQENPTSLDRNVFPTLKFAPDLKQAIRKKGLGCPQAKELNRISAAKLNIEEDHAVSLRQDGVAIALEQNLTTEKLRAWVNERIRPANPSSNNESVQKAFKVLKDLHQTDFSQIPQQDLQQLKLHLQSLLETLP